MAIDPVYHLYRTKFIMNDSLHVQVVYILICAKIYWVDRIYSCMEYLSMI